MYNRSYQFALAIILSLVLLFSLPIASFAHSGGTDSSGGHKDNQNASGLGYYHYHHGMGPHLHPNGICPYSSAPAPKVTPTYPTVPKVININISINGGNVVFTESSGKPFIDSVSRTQVPLRATMEAYGCEVTWNQLAQKAIVTKDGIVVEVPIGAKYVIRNNLRIISDSAALIKNNRTYLPIRVVLEAFGATVNWDGNTQTVIVKN